MPSVTNDAAGRRFVILDTDTPTGTIAGSSHYRDRDDERIFFHTEIDEKFSGRGLAGALTSEALADTAAEGKTIVAVCPYVRKWLDTHDHEFVWRKPTPDDLTWIKGELA